MLKAVPVRGGFCVVRLSGAFLILDFLALIRRFEEFELVASHSTLNLSERVDNVEFSSVRINGHLFELSRGLVVL